MSLNKIREGIHRELDGKLSKTETENLIFEVRMFYQQKGYLPEDVFEWYDSINEDNEE